MEPAGGITDHPEGALQKIYALEAVYWMLTHLA